MTDTQVKFINAKSPDMTRVTTLLDLCSGENSWANRGPLYRKLVESFAAHFSFGPQTSVTPCANAGIALEAMAKLLALREGRALRWVGSAFSFQNLGRGHFADMHFVDCDDQGLLDLDQLKALPEDSFDGLVVVNPFGLHRDFSAYIEYAKSTGKFLLLDNAAGISRDLPDWPWQALSLHHTKPYGMGEGGLAITPAELSEEFYSLINYGAVPAEPSCWVNNGKISDISCAFLIDRLERVDTWETEYFEQAERVHDIARELGLRPLTPFNIGAPAMSWGYLAETEIPLQKILDSKQLTFGKYYKPLADLPKTTELYRNLVNIPTHPDVALLSDRDLREAIERLL